MATIKRKTQNRLNLNSTRIRFDVKKLTPIPETKVYCTSNIKNKKNSVCLNSNKSQIYFKPCFLHDNDTRNEMQTLR